jgi:EAL domain-containing protein (putative c-di-GMP-specific phosphodiesterase class I)
MLIGLRRFEAVNLAYGASAGDGALEEIATRISHFIEGELDGPRVLVRSGGGSFLLVVNEACSRERWQLFADQLAEAISRPMATPAGVLWLSLNVTPADLALGSYVRQLLEIMGQSGFPPRHVTLEVTEQALLHDVHQAARMMADLSSQGIRIALDDFGAGFYNFCYLKVLPLHYLKLDRTMIDGISSDKRDLAVLRAIVAMAKALDLEVIAEGIENEDQRALIAAEGCSYYQGFLRAKPMSAQMFANLAKA